MDFKALVDFNKYTLALAAGGFVYALEKFVPMETPGGRYLLLGLLSILLLSVLLGVAIFAAATAALHADDIRKQRIEAYIRWFGVTHSILLCVGMLVLGGMLYDRVMSLPKQQTQQTCCCP